VTADRRAPRFYVFFVNDGDETCEPFAISEWEWR
jgi:hypothetical protein